MAAWLTLCLCLSSLTAHFIADGLAQIAFGWEACVCVSQPESLETTGTCDPHGIFLLPRPAHAGHRPAFRLALAAPEWRARSHTISPRLPPPKASLA